MNWFYKHKREKNPDHALLFISNRRGWEYRNGCGCRACVSMEYAKLVIQRLDIITPEWKDQVDMVMFLRDTVDIMKERGMVPEGVSNVAVAIMLRLPDSDMFN